MDTLKRTPFQEYISALGKYLDDTDVSKLDEKERDRYDEALKVYRDYYGMIHSAERKGEAKGIAKGKAQIRIATARKLKDMGLSTPDIAEITDLTPEEIEKL